MHHNLGISISILNIQSVNSKENKCISWSLTIFFLVGGKGKLQKAIMYLGHMVSAVYPLVYSLAGTGYKVLAARQHNKCFNLYLGKHTFLKGTDQPLLTWCLPDGLEYACKFHH